MLQYHELGKTGMKVSSLSFGASSLGGVFHELKEQEGIEAVHTAIDAGLNFIDVSPYYGHYTIERLAMQYAVSNPRIATTLFSTTNPQNVLKNVAFAQEAFDEELLHEVREIIGRQMRVSWRNS